MSQEQHEAVCVGCGSPLQSQDEQAPGFVPNSAIGKANVQCRRCFRIRNYGEFLPVQVSERAYQEQVAQIFDNPGLVLYVIDVFDLSGSLVPNLARFVMNSEVVVVVNKVDLLPKGIHYEALSDWILEQVRATRVEAKEVLFVSAASTEGMDQLIHRVGDVTDKPIYVVGMANTGKSTLLNAIAKRFEVQNDPYTVSRRPGTTLALSKFQVEGPTGPLTFVDTPGLVHGTRVIDRLCADCLKRAVPDARIRPKVYQLNPEQTLFLGGFARLDFEAGVRQPIVLYISNQLPVHRSKLERAEIIWEQHRDDILQVPCTECRTSFDDLKAHPIQSTRTGQRVPNGTIPVSGRGRDIVIPGLGWITLSGATFRGRLWLPSWLDPALRPRLVGDLTRSREGFSS
ncbi:ribosome biogenesis GTPase YqeH [Alicyclobacillus fastidiosus]|uniref:Ribosome biogenesis GTPase YqeH n=1 Tax=Alicyclobacillus fastidiosus TaxID=392011 RepID=A0ABY6ZLN0_9BACL|nr:ribosome biogenesis GTPase YqeH [Alicyclobacillus fastidiosus]WAH43764.1 ribosome biogenesis GTPase YqeH [Alicyclobacillus fastidiosus]GMA59984.1 GTP-binding protein [Alicyclobacillus fastidiosus]